MRGVKIAVPADKVENTLDLAFSLGIESATVHEADSITRDHCRRKKTIIEIDTSTPKGKRLTEAFIDAPFFDQEDCFISTRQRRSIVSSAGLSDITQPWVEPGIDICQELWQFNHLTLSLVLRTIVAGGLIAFGLINDQTLILISGILFLPTLPMVLAIGFGSWLRQWRLVMAALRTFGVCIGLLVLSSAVVALASNGPVKYNEFASLPVSALMSVGVGIAAALASSDDAGRRELIGLAATAQIAIVPCWLGAVLILGPSATGSENEAAFRLLGFAMNIGIIIISSTATYILLGTISPALKRLRS
jgi:hypothetical protein